MFRLYFCFDIFAEINHLHFYGKIYNNPQKRGKIY
jgi:hypothetical protein